MPDAFFASQKPRKRKRTTDSNGGGGGGGGRPAKAARTPNGKARAGGKPPRASGSNGVAAAGPSRKRAREDEELDGADASGDDAGIGAVDDLDLRASDEDAGASGDEDAGETPAEKRLRLARLYLDSVKEGLAGDEFDAAEIDREIISARLKQDVIEHAGKVHLFIAGSLDYTSPSFLHTSRHHMPVTAALASADGASLFTASKDGSITRFELSSGKRVAHFPKVRRSGDKKGKGKARAEDAHGHTDEIWALALSSDGAVLASGGKDRRIGVWDLTTNAWTTGFGGHRDAITSLAFRAQTRTLFSGSLDRTLRLHSLAAGAMGFTEALFGHQDGVQALDALRAETAVSVGGRDRTARFWKVPDESQLVFRGGGRSKLRDLLEGGALEGLVDGEGEAADGAPVTALAEKRKGKEEGKRFVEGSLECVAMLDETTFVSGGDSGSIALWSTQKKKPVFTQPLAHGLHETLSATEGVVRSPRAVLALGALRYADLFASGSWDGTIRLWRLDRTLRSFALAGELSAPGVVNSLQLLRPPATALAGAAWAAPPLLTDGVNGAADGPRRGKAKDKDAPVLLVAALAREPRMGRWVVLKDGVRNEAMVVALRPRTL